MKRRLGRNDPCWCGSGKKFKKCHLNREIADPLPPEAVGTAAIRAWSHKLCLHPLAAPGVCDKIVSAHTVQRSGVLGRIVDRTNHVLTFYPPAFEQPVEPEPRRIGWRDASTFTGFCAAHDSKTFKPLEQNAFAGTNEQSFLIGYRALCHEIYQKSGALRAVPVMRELADRGLPVEAQKLIQRQYSAVNAGARKGLAVVEALKSRMDKQLLTADYSEWSRLIVRFEGDLCVASTGAVSPNRDLDGHQLQVLHETDATQQQTLLCGVVATENGGAVVFTWLRSQPLPRRFLDSFLRQGQTHLPSLLVQFMFAHVENTYFSENWWRSLPDGDRQHVRSLALTRNAYYTPFSYSTSRIVPWRVLDAKIEDAA